MDATVNNYLQYAASWEWSYHIWQYVGVIVGCLMILGSIVVASAPPFITRFIDVKTVAFLTAVLTGVNTFIDPSGRARAYGIALAQVWPVLAQVQFDRETNKSGDARDQDVKTDIKTLIDVFAQATANIHEVASVHKPPTPVPGKP